MGVVAENTTSTRAERLAAFIEATGNTEVKWGVNDCSAAPVAWLNRECGLDIRLPTYSDREGAHRVIAKHGGLVNVWSKIAEENGIHERIGEPELGDVALIDTRLYGPIGGICATNRILLIRVESTETKQAGWRPLGQVRNFLKVFRAP